MLDKVGIWSDVRASRVAVLSDIHGNAPALEAVLGELDPGVDLVVFGGDLSWGPLPQETLALIRSTTAKYRCVFIRGNAERALLEAATADSSARAALTERERWMLDQHSGEDLRFLGDFVHSVVVSVDGLGEVCFCHGSPLSDEDLITSETPVRRLAPMVAAIDAEVLVTAHTHLQFDRQVAGIRSINPGSVGMPYEGRQGAFWAILDRDVELRRTDYDVEATCARYLATTDPMAERMIDELGNPTTREELIAHAERLERSG